MHITNRSRSTYNAGWKKFIAFLAIGNFHDPLDMLTLRDIQHLMVYFMDFVRNSRSPPLRASTVDQYLCHVGERLVLQCIITDSSLLRSTRSRFLVTSFRREDALGNPLRLNVAIPMSYSLLCDAVYRPLAIP